ncbi:hypothetical protein BH11PLA2_BH11PLA2_08430 [soil metagenome]
MPDATDPLFKAIAFAARAHRHQLRKDGITPYFSHCVRVMTVTSQIFKVTDHLVLITALLHDTIEDTTTDYDDLVEAFGPQVAGWVAALTKDMRLPEREREDVYHATLAKGPWQVTVCKLADIYDNLNDSYVLTPTKQAHLVKRSVDYLECLKPTLPVEANAAFALTETKLKQVQQDLTKS